MPNDPPARKDYVYFHRMTTRWRDNDVYAHVNNAVYYEYVDTVVNQWLIQEAGLAVPGSSTIGLVVHSACDFYAPLGFPGEITGGLRVARLGTSSVTYDVALFGGAAEQAAARAQFTHVYVAADTRRPEPLPEWLRGALDGLVG